ncbi:MAG: glycosyltransferase family 2 protein, partial [Halieaceae bacterium]|nr:glycosyltransferase family 2 protein [Halieaceae bacterium]
MAQGAKLTCMQVSIIIPSLYSPIINTVLVQLERQSSRDQIGEVLVVGKASMGQKLNRGKVRYVDTNIPVSTSRARNIGIRQARCEILYFLDGDCLPQVDCLEQHLRAHSAGHVLVGGGVLMPIDENYWNLTYNLAIFHEFLSDQGTGARNYLPGLNLTVARSVV